MKTHFRKFRRKLFADAGGQCFYCGASLAYEGPLKSDGRDWLFLAVSSRMDGEHKNPLIRGGPHELANVVAACRSCNGIKRLRTSEEFRFILAFKTGQWPYQFHGERGIEVMPRDMLFVASPDRIENLCAHNFGRRKASRRGHETHDMRKQPLR